MVAALRPVLEYEATLAPVVPTWLHVPLAVVVRWMMKPDSLEELSVQRRSIRLDETADA